MHIEIRNAKFPEEIGLFVQLDRRMFSLHDAFIAEELDGLECFFLMVDDIVAGSVALLPNYDDWGGNASPGTLYIASTGILPEFQGGGLGSLLKAWEIAYARKNGFVRICTKVRASNERSIRMNKKFGFTIMRRISDYYSNPTESAFMMELWVG